MEEFREILGSEEVFRVNSGLFEVNDIFFKKIFLNNILLALIF